MFYITCPQCDTEHELISEAAGTCITCRHCGRDLEIAAMEEEEVGLAPLEPTDPAPWSSPPNAATTLMNEAEEQGTPPPAPKPVPRREPSSMGTRKLKETTSGVSLNPKNKDSAPKLSKKTLKGTGKVSRRSSGAVAAEPDEDEEADVGRPRWLGPAIVGVLVTALVAFGATGAYYLIRASRDKTEDASSDAETLKPARPARPATMTIPASPSSKDKGAVKPSISDAPRSPSSAASGREIYQELLKSTAWIVVRVEKGSISGSGVLVDRTNRLVLTNHHVIDHSLDILVYFPMFDKGKVIVDAKQYMDKTRPAEQITGRVIAKDGRRDLALVQVSRLPEGVPAVPVASRSAAPGDPVHSIGSPGKSDGLWSYTSGTVRQVYHKKWRSKNPLGSISGHEADILETQSPTNPGDSGGPLVNGSGDLVGLTQGTDMSAPLMGIFVDVGEITRFVEDSCKANNLSWSRATPRPTTAASNVLELVKELENPDPLARGKAAQALGEAGPAGRLAVAALLKGLKDADPLYRKLALEALDRIGAPDRSDVDLLRESLKDDNVTVRIYAAEALGRMGGEARAAAPELATRLQEDSSVSVRLQAARALGKIGPAAKQHAFPAVIVGLKDMDQGVRVQAAEALTSLGPLAEADRSVVLDMLGHEDLDVRVFGVQALGQLAGQGKAVVPTLMEQARPGKDPRLRRAALVSLRAFGKEARATVGLLGTILKEDPGELRQAACAVLVQLGADARPAVPALAEGLSSADSPTRAMMLEVLEKLGPDASPAVPALRKLITDKGSDQVLGVLGVLAAIGKDAKEASPTILVLFEGTDSAIFDKAVETLGKIGKPATPYLIGGMRDRNVNVRLGSVRAAGLIGPEARLAAQPLAILGQTDPAATVRAEAVDAFRKVMSGPAATKKK